METKGNNQFQNIIYTAVPNKASKAICTNVEILENSSQQPLTSIEERSIGPKFGKRHIQIISCFLFIVLEYCERVNMSIGIVAMNDSNSTINPDIPTYNWTNKGVVLSSFSWGYGLVQPVAGWLVHRYSPKWFMVGSISTCSFVGIFIPLIAANFGSKGIIVMRVVQGLCQSFMIPAATGLLAKWTPPNERTTYVSLIMSALAVGTISSLLLSGLMAASWYGWPMVFYSFSAVGLVWGVIFAYIGSNDPKYHSTISKQEKFYIENSLKYCGTNQANLPIPWLKIISSLPVWAILVGECGTSLTYWILLTELPSYMAHVMKFKLRTNSVLSSLPYVAKLIALFLFSYISSILERRKVFSMTVIRKIFSTVGFLVPAVTFVLLGNSGPEDVNKAVIQLFIIVSATASLVCAVSVNYLDISPNYTGFMYSMTNGLASMAGIVAPLLVQFIVTDETDPEQWKIIFYLAASISTFAWLFYIIFGSGKLQPWNSQQTGEDK